MGGRIDGRGLLVLVLLVSACVQVRVPDLVAIYRQTAEIQGPERRPVIGLPGTLGSRLVDTETGRELWGGSVRLSGNPAVPEDFRRLALPIGDGTVPNRLLTDPVRPAGVLTSARASVLGVPIDIDVYSSLLATMRLAGWIPFEDPLALPRTSQSNLPPIPPEEANFFPFAYDWRRDLAETVKLFDAHVRAKAEQVALMHGLTAAEPGPVRFNLVAHSMGCLIARYYLMYGTQDLPADGSLPELTWEGARHIAKAVFIAPPNAGSITALDNLVNGKSLGPLLPFYPPALVGAHFSTYALMPRNRHKRVRWADTGEPIEDLYDPALWQRLGWGLASPAAVEELAVLMPDIADPEERRRRALAFQAEALARAKQFHTALDREIEALPPGLEIYLVVGGSYQTPAGASVDPATGALEITAYEEGDGVVLRASSLLDERQGGTYEFGLRTPLKYTSTLFLPEEHVALTQSPVFGDNLLFWLIEGQRVGESLQVADAPLVGVVPSEAPMGRRPDVDR
ncbi:MAG TPA: hypothetical protein VFR34_10300 [Paracoccaceae bacterium]|nr:hypothetical protein [Paracoccaceae bacterium]